MRSGPILVIAVIIGAGCGGRTGLVAPESTDAQGEADAKPEPLDCSVTLSVGEVTVTADCWIDEKVSHRSAVLRWACDAGSAEADFGVPFYGTVQEPSTLVSLSATTTFVWSDGCTWQSEQHIDGELSSGALQYGYSEKPIQGTHCAPAYCTGTAVVAVQ